MAPTRPLVNQQLSACSDIMNIPAEDVVVLEGSVSAEKRAVLWRDHRIIFCTPQTAFNDLKGDRFSGQSIVCVVIDEAHKCTGGYAYATFMEELCRIHSDFRVLALSATPGTDIRRIQEVVSNLKISAIEIRTEDDPDVIPYVHRKHIEIVKCDETIVPFQQQIKEEIHSLMTRPLDDLKSHNLVLCDRPQNLNRYVLPEIEE
jgi:ERCC4-related helicase